MAYRGSSPTYYVPLTLQVPIGLRLQWFGFWVLERLNVMCRDHRDH